MLSCECDAGWSSLVAHWAHNPKVGGSNPPPATNRSSFIFFILRSHPFPLSFVHLACQQNSREEKKILGKNSGTGKIMALTA